MRHGWLLGGVALLVGPCGRFGRPRPVLRPDKVNIALRCVPSPRITSKSILRRSRQPGDSGHGSGGEDQRRSPAHGSHLGHRIPIILYASHPHFAQTNVTPELIDAGTGGFTELLRNRVVLPFTGSYEDLRHVVVHELVHAYMFDLMYGGNATALLARQSFFQVPLWFAEGLAEYTRSTSSRTPIVQRDGAITGYVRL